MGAVSYVSVDQSAKSSKGVVVASETGVLAVLSPNDGSISEDNSICMLIARYLLAMHVLSLMKLVTW